MHYTAPEELVYTFSLFVSPDLEDEKIDLIRGALVIARTEYPDLDIEEYAGRIERMARRVAAGAADLDHQRTLAALNHVVFEQANLRGNRDDYYDPRNSFLNDVLDRGLGIPITLSIIYMEVAKRVGFPLSGVGMPGHFLLKHYGDSGQEILIDCFNRGDILSRQDCQSRLDEIYSGEMKLRPEFLQKHYGDSGQEILIDCFNRGDILSRQDCQSRLDEIYSGEMKLRPEFLHPISRRQILTRMLNNLKTVYLSTRNFRK